MGNLILMPRQTRPLRAEPNVGGRSAEILFFTGVRYYRTPDAVPTPPQARRRRRPGPRTEAPRVDCQA